MLQKVRHVVHRTVVIDEAVPAIRQSLVLHLYLRKQGGKTVEMKGNPG